MDGENTESPTPSKKLNKEDGVEVWPDRDRVVSSTMRTAQTAIALFETKANTQLKTEPELDKVRMN